MRRRRECSPERETDRGVVASFPMRRRPGSRVDRRGETTIPLRGNRLKPMLSVGDAPRHVDPPTTRKITDHGQAPARRGCHHSDLLRDRRVGNRLPGSATLSGATSGRPARPPIPIRPGRPIWARTPRSAARSSSSSSGNIDLEFLEPGPEKSAWRDLLGDEGARLSPHRVQDTQSDQADRLSRGQGSPRSSSAANSTGRRAHTPISIRCRSSGR